VPAPVPYTPTLVSRFVVLFLVSQGLFLPTLLADMTGFTEAAFFPGAVFLLSIFYEKKQMALRTAILYSGSQIGNAFGGLFALAILKLEGAHGIEGWRWLFIVEGIMSESEFPKNHWRDGN
jgi:hypothetical protein